MPGPEEPPPAPEPEPERLDPWHRRRPGWVWAIQPGERWSVPEDGWPGCVD